MDSPVINWTEGRYRSFITSIIRAGFRRFPAKYEALNNAKAGKRTNEATGRMAEHYKCAKCKQEFTAKDVQVDHIKPVVPPSGFTTWDDFISRLFCSATNLQVLCKECHKIKTKKETVARTKARSKK